jgi:sulfate adenylyltransferase
MRADTGVCIWFTGRSGAGKSTVTRALVPLLEDRGRIVTVLDVVPPLAKSWCERTSEGKLLRKAFVAGEVTRHGGIAICVTVSARRQVRDAAREIVGADHFLEIYTDIPPDVSSARKGARTKKPPPLKRVRRAVRRIRSLRGGRDAYEVPMAPDLTIDTVTVPPDDNARDILGLLAARGFLQSDGGLGATGESYGAPASPSPGAETDDRVG